MKRIISFVLRKVPRKYLQLFSHFVLRVMSLFYAGKKVQCAVCENQFRKFLPYGRGNASRSNALCPKCLSLERHRMIWVFLNDKTDFFSAPLKMLHVAPELCFIKRFEALKNLDYTTGDIESPLAMVKMDVHSIPFEPNTFDVVFCNHVLEHVESDTKVLSEFLRVLKPGGWALLQSPIDHKMETTYEDASLTTKEERYKAFGQDDHLRMFGKDYGKRLAKAGFEVEEINLNKNLSEAEIHRKGFDKNEIIYWCKKN